MQNELTFEQALEYIHARPRLQLTGDEASRRAASFLSKLGNPGRGLQIVHITGTNGKGSAAAMLSSMLTASGRKTGLFISPYVLEFRERIQIDGKMIPPDALALLVEKTMDAVNEMEREGQPVNEFILDFGL
ncbi:MAG TPA: bifunctional folylpolyglutamate synthase/dihydrofolate synthase, partial [Candidatus Faecivivens stercoripullorum]|nr:bifunctional folylpolyglutamate synthase/dihydrofolate synthase [Candidatus Faecivivens stercoripullorum]